MKTPLIPMALTMALAGPALADIDADALVRAYQDQGYTRIEVQRGPTQLKLEAIRDGVEVEVIYDLATGAVLKQETSRVRDGDDTSPGVEIDIRSRDFLDDEDDEGSDDESDDDEDDESDDGDEDDHSGSGGGDDDDLDEDDHDESDDDEDDEDDEDEDDDESDEDEDDDDDDDDESDDDEDDEDDKNDD